MTKKRVPMESRPARTGRPVCPECDGTGLSGETAQRRLRATPMPPAPGPVPPPRTVRAFGMVFDITGDLHPAPVDRIIHICTEGVAHYTRVGDAFSVSTHFRVDAVMNWRGWYDHTRRYMLIGPWPTVGTVVLYLRSPEHDTEGGPNDGTHTRTQDF